MVRLVVIPATLLLLSALLCIVDSSPVLARDDLSERATPQADDVVPEGAGGYYESQLVESKSSYSNQEVCQRTAGYGCTETCKCPHGTPAPECNYKGQIRCTGCKDENYENINFNDYWRDRRRVFRNRFFSKKCVWKQCKCANGTPLKGAACKHHDETACKSCKSGYYLTDTTYQKYSHEDQRTGWGVYKTVKAKECAYKYCKCPHGHFTHGTACPQHGATKCANCDSGYHLDNGQCGKCQCKHGSAGGNNCHTGGEEEELVQTSRRLLGSGGGPGLGSEGGYESDCTKHKSSGSCSGQKNAVGKSFCKWDTK